MSIWTNIGVALSAIGTGGAQLIDWLGGLVSPVDDGRKTVAFTVAMIAISAKMAKADGVVTADEILAFREIFDIPPGEERNVSRLYDLAKQDVAGYETYARRVVELFPEDQDTLIDILDGLFHIAKADGVIHESEMAFLSRVAEIFDVGTRCFNQVKARHVTDGADPYLVLGIDPTASDNEVKKQYRLQVAETHPDRMIARGVPEEFVRIAQDRLVALNLAWEQISAERRL